MLLLLQSMGCTAGIMTSAGRLLGRGLYIQVLPDRFILKSAVIEFILKESSRTEHERQNQC